MLRLTEKMEDGSYRASRHPELPGENSYEYKNMIIDRCGRSEDLINDILCKSKAIMSEEDKKPFADWLKYELSYYGFTEPLT